MKFINQRPILNTSHFINVFNSNGCNVNAWLWMSNLNICQVIWSSAHMHPYITLSDSKPCAFAKSETVSTLVWHTVCEPKCQVWCVCATSLVESCIEFSSRGSVNNAASNRSRCIIQAWFGLWKFWDFEHFEVYKDVSNKPNFWINLCIFHSANVDCTSLRTNRTCQTCAVKSPPWSFHLSDFKINQSSILTSARTMRHIMLSDSEICWAPTCAELIREL